MCVKREGVAQDLPIAGGEDWGKRPKNLRTKLAKGVQFLRSGLLTHNCGCLSMEGYDEDPSSNPSGLAAHPAYLAGLLGGERGLLRPREVSHQRGGRCFEVK